MRFLEFNDKSDIPRAYRKRDTRLLLCNSKILLFEDYSAEVAKKRRAFSGICSQLFNRKICFSALLHFWSPGVRDLHRPTHKLKQWTELSSIAEILTKP